MEIYNLDKKKSLYFLDFDLFYFDTDLVFKQTSQKELEKNINFVIIFRIRFFLGGGLTEKYTALSPVISGNIPQLTDTTMKHISINLLHLELLDIR